MSEPSVSIDNNIKGGFRNGSIIGFVEIVGCIGHEMKSNTKPCQGFRIWAERAGGGNT